MTHDTHMAMMKCIENINDTIELHNELFETMRQRIDMLEAVIARATNPPVFGPGCTRTDS